MPTPPGTEAKESVRSNPTAESTSNVLGSPSLGVSAHAHYTYSVVPQGSLLKWLFSPAVHRTAMLAY
ncbi:hypothetical protein HNR49_002392 [Halobacterium salinarum]|uniref:Uncharacterized protein n=1 Tax=Halobacterium salinarum TaxID=2242 RepID=A0A841HFI4_HALSI|nr:hypothetical protein [Halobacterium salinarum]